METKKQVVDRLLRDYTDVNRRVTLYHKDESRPDLGQFDSENQGLWSGEACILTSVNKVYDQRLGNNCQHAMKLIEVKDDDGQVIPGLYSRQPESYKGDNTVSHDEYTGICCQAAVIQPLRKRVDEIVEYGERYDWCFLDTHPKAKPLKPFLLNPVNWFYAFKALKDKKYRKKNDTIYQISHIRQPDERAFYKIISTKYKPSRLEIFLLCLGICLSTFKEKGQVSSKKMAYLKIKAMDLVRFTHPLYELTKRFFHGRMINMYGKNYLTEMYKIYNKDTMHPFHTLAKARDEERGENEL